MLKLVYKTDLKSVAHWACGFKSHPDYKKKFKKDLADSNNVYIFVRQTTGVGSERLSPTPVTREKSSLKFKILWL